MLDDVPARDVVPLGAAAAVRGARVPVVHALLHDEEDEVDALRVEEGLAAGHLAGAHAVHHAVADAVAVDDDAAAVGVPHDDLEGLVEELLEREHLGLDDDGLVPAGLLLGGGR